MITVIGRVYVTNQTDSSMWLVAAMSPPDKTLRRTACQFIKL